MQENTKVTDQPVTKKEDAAEVAEVVRVFGKLPEADRAKVLYLLKGIEFAAETAAPARRAAMV